MNISMSEIAQLLPSSPASKQVQHTLFNSVWFTNTYTKATF